MGKRILIVGGGVSGLAAGIFAQKYGYSSRILEALPSPGGECAAWERGGYHIDGCLHWLTGTKKGTQLYDLWRELSVIGGDDLLFHDALNVIELSSGRIEMCRDLSRFRRRLLTDFPDDAKEIRTLCRDIKRLRSFRIPAEAPVDMLPPLKRLALLPMLLRCSGILAKYDALTNAQYAERFSYPALNALFSRWAIPTQSVSSFLFAMANFTCGNGAAIKGGSSELVSRLVSRYRELSGELSLKTPVERIVVENGRAAGVLAGGEFLPADYVIASCDPHMTLQKLLADEYPFPELSRMDARPKDDPLNSNLMVAYAVSCIPDLPASYYFEGEPVRVGTRDISIFGIKNFSHEPSFAPPGHTVFTCGFYQSGEDYDWWRELMTSDPSAYRAQKERIAGELAARIEARFPELRGRLETLDILTPLTYERFCGAYRGAWMGWRRTPSSSKKPQTSGQHPGIANLYITGQWLMPPGGLPCAAVTGKFTVLRINAQEKKPR